ncbi:hypothetical protein C8J56DRAFT_798481 [Mycena floridula]|nr:hypothetical protein C8J56DRAFT_798481 [Mycena floridula]
MVNLNGKQADSITQTAHKWRELRGMIMRKKLANLALVETHMTTEQIIEFENSFYDEGLEVYHSAGDSSSCGIAFILNKRLTNTKDVVTYEIIPGRALGISHPWHGNEIITGLVLYAPADGAVPNCEFYNEVVQIWMERELPIVDWVTGDHNMVEEQTDHLPEEKTPLENILAIGQLKSMFGLEDGWRNNHGDECEYTHMSHTGSQARLDRIYTTGGLMARTRQWEIEDLGTLTDHKMVSFTLSSPQAPYQGPGRYMMQGRSVEDRTLISNIQELGCSMWQDLLNGLAPPGTDVQLVWANFKNEIIIRERDNAKRIVGAERQKLAKLKQGCRDLKKEPVNESIQEREERIRTLAISETEIKRLIFWESQKHKANNRVRTRVEVDKVSPLSMKQMKEEKSQNSMSQLVIPGSNPPKFITWTDKMAEFAGIHHASKQFDETEINLEQKDQDINYVLGFINRRLSPEQAAKLAQCGDPTLSGRTEGCLGQV